MDFFDKAYQGRPPWDIGRPQREVVTLEEQGKIKGDVLDTGCGTGENALYLAARSHRVWGVDSAPAAIANALEKARKRGLEVTFLVMDTLNLREIGRTFDTVIDIGLFHTLSDAERPCYVRNLSEVLKKGGKVFILAFSEHEPAGYGPRRITQMEIRDTFTNGWRIDTIQEGIFESRTRPEGSRAWLAALTKT